MNIIKLKNNKNVENVSIKNNPPLKASKIQEKEHKNKSIELSNSILNNKIDNDKNKNSLNKYDEIIII